jgi:hypothetical protein
MASQKCDIVRAAAQAFRCGLCGGIPGPGCDQTAGGACAALKAAGARQELLRARAGPGNLSPDPTARALRGLALQNVVDSLAGFDAQVAAAYPVASFADAQVAWSDFERCCRGPPTAGGCAAGYYDRADLAALGYAPAPLIGGKALAGQVWGSTAPVPVWCDSLMNPDLLPAVFILILAGVLVAALRGWRPLAPLGAAWRRLRRGVAPGAPPAQA